MKLLTLIISKPTSLRLDQFLIEQKISPSRSQISKWIKSGFVTVNHQQAKPADKIKLGDQITVHPPEVIPTSLKPEAISLHILYEDNDIVVINKSAEMVVHPGAGHWEGTLVHALLAHCKGLSQVGGVERPGIVHRLDKGTSGVIVVAKNDEAHRHLSQQFKNHTVKKIYWAVVYGRLKKKEGTISGLMARSPSHRKKFAISSSKGKEAITHYKVLKEGEGLSFVEISLETGRTHQIRVHFTHEGHSLVGDPLYGGHSKRVKGILNLEKRRLLQDLNHPLLHARTLGFVHPVTQKKMECTAEFPEEFQKILEVIFE